MAVAEFGGDNDLRQRVWLPLHTNISTIGILVAPLGTLACLGGRAGSEIVLLPAVGELIRRIASPEGVSVDLELGGECMTDVATKHLGGQDPVGITARRASCSPTITTAPGSHAHLEAHLVAVAGDVGEACIVRVVKPTDDRELIVVSEAT